MLVEAALLSIVTFAGANPVRAILLLVLVWNVSRWWRDSAVALVGICSLRSAYYGIDDGLSLITGSRNRHGSLAPVCCGKLMS